MPAGFGLDRRPFVNLAIGAVIGAGAMSAIFLLEWWGGLLSIVRVSPMTALADDLSSFVAVPLIEEFVFRCAILGGLLLLVRRRSLAVVISAAVFGALHPENANATALSVLGTTLGGLAYGGAFAATERIWLPFGLHFGWNYAQARVFGFAISGGAVRGPTPFVQQYDLGPAIRTGTRPDQFRCNRRSEVTRLRVGLLVAAGVLLLIVGTAEPSGDRNRYPGQDAGRLGGAREANALTVHKTLMAFGDMKGLYLNAKVAQIDAMNRAQFSKEEFEWVRKQLYHAAGLRLTQLDVSEILDAVREPAVKVRQFEQDGRVLEPNGRLARPLLPKLQAWRSLGFFGL